MATVNLYLVILGAFLCSACVANKVNRRLAYQSETQTAVVRRMRLLSGDQTYTGTLNWKQASKMMEEQNIGFLQSKNQIIRAHRADRKTWFSLAPRLFAYVNVSKSLTELADITGDDISLSILANLAIPNPMQFYAQLYGNRLVELRSDWQHELNRRQLYGRLYQIFQRIEELREAELELVDDSKLNQLSLEKMATAIYDQKVKRERLNSQKEKLRVRVNFMLGTPGQNWKLVGSPPNISYADKIDHLSLESGYGKLGLMLQTLQIETLTLTVWNVKVSRWPRFDFGMSVPPLYQSEGNSGFDPDQMRLFAGVSKSINFEDPLELQRLEDTETRVKHTREILMLKTERDASNLYLMKRNYRQILTRRSHYKVQLKREKSRVAGSEVLGQTFEGLKSIQSINAELKKLDRQLTQLDLQLWPWDEKYWKKY